MFDINVVHNRHSALEEYLNLAMGSLIHHYVLDDDLGNVQFEIESGVFVDLRDGLGWTPLHHACHAGYFDIVSYLTSQGASVNIVTGDEGGNTPIHQASSRGHLEIVKHLLDSGTDFSVTNYWGDSAFHQACARGRLEIAELFLDYGFPVNAQNNVSIRRSIDSFTLRRK